MLKDLSELNKQFSNRFSKGDTTFVATGDLLAGKANCSKFELMNAMLECWSTDPVHGDKLAYTKIAMGLLEKLSQPAPAERNDDLVRADLSKKRPRGEDTDPDPEPVQFTRNFQRRESTGSAYNSWPGENRRGRGGYGSAGGSRRYF